MKPIFHKIVKVVLDFKMFFHDRCYFRRGSFFIRCLGSCHSFLKHIAYKKQSHFVKRKWCLPFKVELRSYDLVATRVPRFAQQRLEMPALQRVPIDAKIFGKHIVLSPLLS